MKFRAMQCVVTDTPNVKTDEDQPEIKAVFCGTFLGAETKFKKGGFYDRSWVYNPETGTILSYPSIMVKIPKQENDRAVREDYK